MSKDNLVFVFHIRDCISKIFKYVDGLSKEEFLQSDLIHDAVIRNFEIIGEASKKLDLQFRNRYPNVPWRKMSGMRDVLIHDYMGVDLWSVWDTINSYLPEVQRSIQEIISTETDSSN